MLQRYFIFFLLGFSLTSCEFFKKKEHVSETVIDTIIDYKSVDSFPLFPNCDSIPSIKKQQICTQIKLSQHIYASIADSEIITSKPVNDTILVKLKIDRTGKSKLSSLAASQFVKEQLPNLESHISKGIEELPTLKPAIKRGMPVTTEFSLPIVIKN